MALRYGTHKGRNPEQVSTDIIKANEGTNGKATWEQREEAIKAFKNDYDEAVDNYDLKKAGAIVDAYAKVCGWKVKAFHGTPNIFDRFDINKVGEHFTGVDIDYNFFFTASKKNASGYGSNVMPVYLKMDRPNIYAVDVDKDFGFSGEDLHETLIQAHDFGEEGGVDYKTIVENENSDGATYYVRFVDGEARKNHDAFAALARSF